MDEVIDGPAPVGARCARTRWWWAAWAIYLTVWTLLLETPEPGRFDPGWVSPWYRVVLSKVLHVGGFTGLALLSAVVPLPPRRRWVMLVVLVLHSMITEYVQNYVPGRTGCWSDVGINTIGIGLGVLASWPAWSPFREREPVIRPRE